MADSYLPAALDKRIEQARQRVKAPHHRDSEWTIGLLGHLADEAEAAQKMLATLAEEPQGLPREDGHIVTSAAFGHGWLVEILYNTEADGAEVPEEVHERDLPRTLHGPFSSEEEAQSWMDAYPDGDTDIYDIRMSLINLVRP